MWNISHYILYFPGLSARSLRLHSIATLFTLLPPFVTSFKFFFTIMIFLRLFPLLYSRIFVHSAVWKF